MPLEPIVHIVEDDSGMRESLRWLVASVGLDAQTHETAQAFLDAYDPRRPGCLVLDVRLPGMSGLELQSELLRRGLKIPTIFITGHGDVPMAVRAVQAGALDFIQKPFGDQVLLDLVHRALALEEGNREEQRRYSETRERFDALTPREEEVMRLVVDGKANRQIAEELGVSPRTVEVHRARVMQKVGAGCLADLVRMCLFVESHTSAPETAESPAIG